MSGWFILSFDSERSKNNEKRLVETFSHYTDSIYTLKFQGISKEIQLSYDQVVLVKKPFDKFEWVRADELVEGEQITLLENRHGASLRIITENFDDFLLFEKKTGLDPSKKGKKGAPKHPGSSRLYPHNIWILESPLSKTEELSSHLKWLWNKICTHRDTLIRFKKSSNNVEIDVFCSYTSNCDHSGLELDPESLKIFTELQIKMQLSIIA